MRCDIRRQPPYIRTVYIQFTWNLYKVKWCTCVIIVLPRPRDAAARAHIAFVIYNRHRHVLPACPAAHAHCAPYLRRPHRACARGQRELPPGLYSLSGGHGAGPVRPHTVLCRDKPGVSRSRGARRAAHYWVRYVAVIASLRHRRLFTRARAICMALLILQCCFRSPAPVLCALTEHL